MVNTLAAEKSRCAWVGTDPLMIAYHDLEWGVPIHDDRKWFEKLVLDGAQAGLSWSTILRKRDGYRSSFAQFDPGKVARFTPKDVERLMLEPGIVRNRLKIESTIKNARGFLEVQREFGSFDAYIWSFVDGATQQNRRRRSGDIPAKTELSDAISKQLKKRGFSFVGSTIVYAIMQAAGLVNDHLVSCYRHRELA